MVPGVRRILPHPTSTARLAVFFYELHEGDDEVYSDVLVASESEWEPQEFFELVQRVRHDVQHGYEQNTLIEAIALVLERDYELHLRQRRPTRRGCQRVDPGRRQLPRRSRRR